MSEPRYDPISKDFHVGDRVCLITKYEGPNIGKLDVITQKNWIITYCQNGLIYASSNLDKQGLQGVLTIDAFYNFEWRKQL